MGRRSRVVASILTSMLGVALSACGAGPTHGGSDSVSSASEPAPAASSSAIARTAGPPSWFQPVGSYQIVVESSDGYQMTGDIHVGPATRLGPQVPFSTQLENCGTQSFPGPESADLIVPVKYVFTNTTPGAGYRFSAFMGVQPDDAGAATGRAPAGIAEYRYSDQSVGCRSSDSRSRIFGGRYNLESGSSLIREGFVYFQNYYTANASGRDLDAEPVLIARPVFYDTTAQRTVSISGPSVRGQTGALQIPLPLTGGPVDDAPTGPAVPPFFLGEWKGTIEQSDGPVYEAELQVTAGAVGDVVGTVNYPTIDCSGDLYLQETTEDRLLLEERLTSGFSSCVDGVSVSLARQADGSLTFAFEGEVEGAGVMRRS